MKKVLVIRIVLVSMGFMFYFNNTATAQVKEEVISVKAYDPTVGDAYKINILPDINDSSNVKPVFSYKVFPKQLPVDYQVTPIQPAKMVGEPLTKLYSTYLKAGYGNYNTLLGEAGFNLQRSKNYSGAFYIKHLSSISKLKLENDVKMPASYSDNKVTLSGKKFYENSTLHGDVNYLRNAFHYYGYDTSMYNTTLDKKTIFQRYSTVTANTGLYTNYLDSAHINYDVNVKYEFFDEEFKGAYQNWIDVTARVDNYYKNELIGGNVDVSWVNKNSPLDTVNNALVVINPFVRFFGDQWRVQCGLAMNVDAFTDTVSYHFYPSVLLQYNVIENFLVPFAGFDGGMIQNHYSKVTKENMYIRPGLLMKNTNNQMNLHLGIRGNFSKRISFLIKGTYGLYKDMYFFVNDTLGVGNCFDAVYDDETQLLHFNGEISYKNSEKLNFFLKGNYYKYTLKTIAKPWHKPGWDITLSTRYNLRNKIVVSLDVFALGDRFAPNFKAPDSPYKLKKIIDANLGVEYRYSKILSAFINLNNVTAGKNYYWNFYPTQRFQIIGGLTYSF